MTTRHKEHPSYPTPRDPPDELIVEADADDAEGTTDAYMISYGTGGISLNLPSAVRHAFGSEDDEVIVIEQKDRPRMLRGEVDIWIRDSRPAASWRAGTGEVIRDRYRSIGQYGFDDEDDRATEVVHLSSDFAEIDRRAMHLKPSSLEEDREIIVPSPSHHAPARNPSRMSESSGDESTRILQAHERPGPRFGDLPANRGDDRTRLIPEQVREHADASDEQPGIEDEVTRIAPLPGHPRARALAAAHESENAFEDDEATQIADPGEDRARAPGIKRSRLARKKRPVEDPVAKLSPTPAAPLKPSQAPPLSTPPVPSLPNAIGGTGTKGGMGARNEDAASRPTGAVPRNGAAAPLPASPSYFQRDERHTRSNRLPFVLALLLTLVFVLAMLIRHYVTRSAEVDQAREHAHAAMVSADATQLTAALEEVDALHDPESLGPLRNALAWSLYRHHGIEKGGLSDEDGTAEDASAPESDAARIERELFEGNYRKADALVTAALGVDPSNGIFRRLAMESVVAAEAAGLLSTAAALDRLDKLSKPLAEENTAPTADMSRLRADFRAARARILERAGKREEALKAYAMALEDDAHQRDALIGRARLEPLVRMDPNASGNEEAVEKARAAIDERLRALLDGTFKVGSPLDRAEVYRARAENALRAGHLNDAILYLGQARNESAAAVDASLLLGRIELDRGRLSRADPILTTAFELAPRRLDVTDEVVRLKLDRADFAGARDIIRNILPEEQEDPLARLAKARFARRGGDLEGAESQLAAIDSEWRDALPVALERAFLALAEGRDDVSAELERLQDRASKEGRLAMIPVLAAYRAGLEPSPRARVSSARKVLKKAAGNARALSLIGDIFRENGELESAEKAYRIAEAQGELPEIRLGLALVAAADPERRSEALALAEEVLAMTGEGPVRERSAALVQELKRR